MNKQQILMIFEILGVLAIFAVGGAYVKADEPKAEFEETYEECVSPWSYYPPDMDAKLAQQAEERCAAQGLGAVLRGHFREEYPQGSMCRIGKMRVRVSATYSCQSL